VTKLITAKDYSLADQITRSTRSIMANIAEGYGRYTFRDFKQFLTVARGSLTETQNHLYIALDMQYLTQEEFQRLYDLSVDVYKLINGLTAHLKDISKTKKQP
jgi:four helix bundle protein